MSDTLLESSLRHATALIADRLPAAFTLDGADPVTDADVGAHTMPADAKAVRWVLGDGVASLVVVVQADAAELLLSISEADSLAAALAPRIVDGVAALAPLFGGQVPAIDEGAEVDPTTALADGPGQPVSVGFHEDDTHRATVGLNLDVSDPALHAPAGAGGGVAAAEEAQPPAAGQGVPLTGEVGGAAPGGLPLTGGPASGATGGNPLSSGSPAAAGPGGTPIAGMDPNLVAAMGGPQAVLQAMQAMQAQQAAAQGLGGRSAAAAPPGVQASAASFASFDQLAALPGHPHPLALLGEVEMGVTAELGRTELTVRDVLGLTPGSIIELDRAAGSPVDVVVNGTLIARGEVVVIDEEFGIRITEIMGMPATGSQTTPARVAQ